MQQENLRQFMLNTSHLSGGNLAYVEGLFESWMSDPASVPSEWQQYFKALPNLGGTADMSHAHILEQFRGLPKRGVMLPGGGADPSQGGGLEHEKRQVRVVQLISSYRTRGHQHAKLDPLGLMHREQVPDLELEFHQLSPADNNTVFATEPLALPQKSLPLSELVSVLEDIYCSSIGYEYMHIVNMEERQWIQKRIEGIGGKPSFPKETRLHILERLSAAEGLEKHLDAKYPGTKRFGLEGGESLIHSLDDIIQRAGEHEVKEIVIGMAHRGRLNVLVNTLGKNPSVLFDEFEGRARYNNSGDVKYHQGFSSNIMTPGGEVHCSMAFNPSHLEIVSPVAIGSVRARQDRRKDPAGETVLPVSIHGDASFAGQGVVMETFQLSQTRAYGTGGTLHIVINNQVGFTTSRQDDARSTEYCTDVAKMVQAPIFHVNADDPEAVLFVTRLALDFRNTFRKDSVVDLICYRRRGHNETDEPASTQPLMYKVIRSLATTRALYAEKLIAEGLLSQDEAEALNTSYRKALDEGTHVVKSLATVPNTALYIDWRPYIGHDMNMPCDTTIRLDRLKALGEKLVQIPEGFSVNRQVAKVLEDRSKMAKGEQLVDWGCAELLAYASLLDTNYKVRITGQDVGRGTFSHRHAVLHDQNTGKTFVPLRFVSESQRKFAIYDSVLSEEAVLAFEYGYATTRPDALVIWEAQFGDFANGAQVVFDQFISSGEYKWERLCGLVTLLPHGYEGQGPEHSSARLERYLQLCAQQNMQVCIPSTPAQVFHMLRRQVIRPLRKPLIVMTPKSLLRHKEAVSTLEELANGSFQTVLGETDQLDAKKVERLILCSGKVYYELRAKRRELGLDNAAIVRLEQLYPFPLDLLGKVIAPYVNLKTVVWCQEEPQNQGAWYSSQHHMRNVIARHNPALNLSYAGREASASPAAGYMALHLKEQEQLVKDAFGLSNAR
ncbi:MAG: 2-oxoglutarate dehydrogenase E1 component [Pseudomonadales bacterium]|jgi:2-oxoglutarate dehydrogenase E1 component|nr:2-oxoglutarate dehydrogenase E1 component [Pseudomonadales bacterium]